MYFIKRYYFICVAIINGLAWELESACFSCLCSNITKQWRGWLCAESAAWACPACRWAQRICSPGPTPMGRDPKPWPQNTRRASPSAPRFWWRCCGESTSLCEWRILISCFLPVCLVAENFNVKWMSYIYIAAEAYVFRVKEGQFKLLEGAVIKQRCIRWDLWKFFDMWQ